MPKVCAVNAKYLCCYVAGTHMISSPGKIKRLKKLQPKKQQDSAK